MKNKMQFEEAAGRVLMVLSRQVGRENAIGMDALHERVFGERVNHKINDTRKLRKLITALRRKGIPIGAVSSRSGGGYYLVRAGSELEEYCHRIHRRGLHALVMEARLRKMALPELLGQMSMHLSHESGVKGHESEGQNDGA